MIRILVIFILVAINMFSISSCSKHNDQKAYEEVIATMSMEKAKRFFNNHPDSHYKDILVNEIIEWCNQEKTEECYRIILDTIPKDHIRYKELSSYYK